MYLMAIGRASNPQLGFGERFMPKILIHFDGTAHKKMKVHLIQITLEMIVKRKKNYDLLGGSQVHCSYASLWLRLFLLSSLKERIG